MEAAILTILLLFGSSPRLTWLVSLKASQNCRAPTPEKLEATERRRSNYLPGCSRLEARAGGSGSRHLEPPLSPPFLSRSPPPPEMAEPRPGSHTPKSLALAGFRGGWKRATNTAVVSGPPAVRPQLWKSPS